MSFLDFLKGKVLDIPDKINLGAHPREEFTRPAVIVDNRPLGLKADIFWREISRDWRHGAEREFYQYAEPFDGGDSAYHHGWYTSMCALKGDHGALKLALTGLEKFVYVGKDDRLSRGVDVAGGKMVVGDPNRTYYQDGDYLYHQDCSESSLIGILTACFFIDHMNARNDLHGRAGILIDRLAKQVIKDGYRLMNEDGSPGKYGDLRPNIKTAPIRLGSLACLLLLAYTYTQDPTYKKRYEDIVKGRMGTLTHQETHFLWVYPWYQTILAYQNYMILSMLDVERSHTFERSVELLYQRTNHEGNPLYAYISKMVLGEIPGEYLAQAKKTLDEVSADPKRGRTGKDPGAVDLRGSEWDIGFSWGRKWLRGGKTEAKQPLPRHLRPSADFFPQRNPYSLHGSSGHHYNSMDFCLEYYLGKHEGAL